MTLHRYALLVARLCLAVAALGWGVSILGVVLPGETAIAFLNRVSGGDLQADPLLVYWLRMTAWAFAFIGALFGWCAWRPLERYALSLALLAFQLGGGLLLLAFGLAMDLGDHVFWADALFCIDTGLLGLVFLPLAKRTAA